VGIHLALFKHEETDSIWENFREISEVQTNTERLRKSTKNDKPEKENKVKRIISLWELSGIFLH
jgi:hypothetical protein